MDNPKGYFQVLSFLPPQLREPLSRLPEQKRRQVTEIRLRQGKTLCLTLGGGSFFLQPSGQLSPSPAGGVQVTGSLLQETLLSCCGRSLHSCADQLRQGFVTLPGGHRAGVAGTARTEGGQVLSVHGITSLNIRIAGAAPDGAALLTEKLFGGGLCGALIAGPPLSGKTTLLKGIIGSLSGGWRGQYLRVAAADERGELTGCGGETADILTGYPKAYALELAVRSLSPQLLCCDELAAGEAEAVLTAMNAGVPLLCTIHASSPEELRRKRWLRPLLDGGVFDRIALLSGCPGCPARVFRAAELLQEGLSCCG